VRHLLRSLLGDVVGRENRGVAMTEQTTDAELILAIARRASALFTDHDTLNNVQDFAIDLSVVHRRTPLRLAALLHSNEFDLMHDVLGINTHLDHVTLTLGNGFEPRYRAYDPPPPESPADLAATREIESRVQTILAKPASPARGMERRRRWLSWSPWRR
jgi:hypothetical protein